MGILLLRGTSNNDWEYTKATLFVLLLIGLGIPSVLGMCYLISIIFLKILNSGRTVINFDKWCIRDLPKHCSPAISSLIYDLKIDVYKDYTATILFSILGATTGIGYFIVKDEYKNESQNTFNLANTEYIRTEDGRKIAYY